MLLTAVCLSIIGWVWTRTREKGNLYLSSVISGVLVLFVLSQWIDLEHLPGGDIVASAFHMGALSLMLVWITTVIWHLKPLYARYPFIFTFSPVLLLIGFPWISWVPSLMHLFFMVLEGGILLILILLWISIRKKLPSSVLFLSTWGTALVLWSGHLLPLEEGSRWITHIFASIVIVLGGLLYEQLVHTQQEFQKP